MTEIVAEAKRIIPRDAVDIAGSAQSEGLLLADWLNRLIFEMAVRHMLVSVRLGVPQSAISHKPPVSLKSCAVLYAPA